MGSERDRAEQVHGQSATAFRCRWLWTVACAAFTLIALAGCYGHFIQAVLDGWPEDPRPASTWKEDSVHRNFGGYIGAQPKEEIEADYIRPLFPP